MATLRSINQDDLRNHNLSVVLDSLLRATEPMSRADLAKKTGLTKAAMSVLVSLMLDNEILVEGAPSGQSLYGRPSIPLEIKGGCLCGMGLQANTDGYGVVVLDLDGSVVGEQWVDADMANADERAIFARLDELALQQEEALATSNCLRSKRSQPRLRALSNRISSVTRPGNAKPVPAST